MWRGGAGLQSLAPRSSWDGALSLTTDPGPSAPLFTSRCHSARAHRLSPSHPFILLQQIAWAPRRDSGIQPSFRRARRACSAFGLSDALSKKRPEIPRPITSSILLMSASTPLLANLLGCPRNGYGSYKTEVSHVRSAWYHEVCQVLLGRW
jgi:hypothetical protein